MRLCQLSAQLCWCRDDISYHRRHPCHSLPLRLSFHEAPAAPEQCFSLVEGRYLLWTHIECGFSQKLASRVDIPPTGLLLVPEQMYVTSVAWSKKLDGWLLLSFRQSTKGTYSESHHLFVALNPWQVFPTCHTSVIFVYNSLFTLGLFSSKGKVYPHNCVSPVSRSVSFY